MVALGVVGRAAGGGGGEVNATVTEDVRFPPGPLAVRVYVVEFSGDTLRLPALCTGPTDWSIETLVALLTSQRNVEDCPRWIEVGSAENCEIVGGAGAGAGFGASVGAGAGGGGGGGAFFLHPAANIASDRAIPMTVIFRLSNMNLASQTFRYFPQKGLVLLPCVVNGCTCLPSAAER